MKNVNLLPDWYLHQQRQKKHLQLHLFIMMLVGAGMVISTAVGRARVYALELHQHQLANKVTEVGNLEPELIKRQNDLRKVLDIQSAYRELGNTIPMSHVIQQIQNDMTAGMALSHINIDVHAEPVKGSGFVGDTKHPPRYHDIAHLTVVGIAPNDVQIAQLIGKISANPLFGECSLNFTRTDVLRDYLVRRFEIQMQMDLDSLANEDAETANKSLAKGNDADAR